MTPEMILPAISIVIGLVSGWIGAYVGMRVGIVRLETHMETARKELEKLSRRSHLHNEDLLIHDAEIGDLMQELNLPRIQRQTRREI